MESVKNKLSSFWSNKKEPAQPTPKRVGGGFKTPAAPTGGNLTSRAGGTKPPA
jgi:hypothetical protein